MMRQKTVLLAIAMTLLMLSGCRQRQELETGNAAYYWRTSLRLDSTERVFLNTHHINKVYCRYFDVVINNEKEGPVPNATISFRDTLPEGVELVPTIYITENCMHQRHVGLAEKIVKRILQMNETNDIKGVREIQIDCDYTTRSLKTYYDFLRSVRTALSESTHDSLRTAPMTLSATIRLHQLSMPVPPVDYGVLMIYNTGDPQKFDQRNPILDLRDVFPYVSRLGKYDLPLAAAYPVYHWTRTIHNVRVEHSVEADEILRVKQTVEEARNDLSRSIITYHLDKENIDRYKPETYEAIYHH